MSQAAEDKFAVYYSDKASHESFRPYQVLVLDRDNHPPLQRLTEDGKLLLGYLSLGEISDKAPSFGTLKQNGLVLQENPNWKGSYTIDLRNPLWGKIAIEALIPAMLHDGFDGIFIDTLDSPLELENSNPAKYKGMNDAAVHLIRAIKTHYPQTPLMVNRAYTILPRIAASIEMELGESVYADYDFDRKTYGKVEPELYRQQVQWLQEAKQKNPALQVYTLDYTDPNDKKQIAEIYRTERSNGFIPYVATVGLDRLVDEPETP